MPCLVMLLIFERCLWMWWAWRLRAFLARCCAHFFEIVWFRGCECSVSQIAKLLGERWRNLLPEDKVPFEEEAAAAKEQYKIDLAAYKAKKAAEEEALAAAAAAEDEDEDDDEEESD